EFLRGERLRAARLWLTTTDLPIREIGVACGFRSPEYFVQAFREEEGVTPSRYRRKGAKSER
ncbi:MAG: helix-turn-helix domain-containing protein, partial [Opitutaceae bacterium]|nr:helix-turn-helix domain-containing protein [Opitutaceae bacterium]